MPTLRNSARQVNIRNNIYRYWFESEFDFWNWRRYVTNGYKSTTPKALLIRNSYIYYCISLIFLVFTLYYFQNLRSLPTAQHLEVYKNVSQNCCIVVFLLLLSFNDLLWWQSRKRADDDDMSSALSGVYKDHNNFFIFYFIHLSKIKTDGFW